MTKLHIPAGYRFSARASGIKTSGKPDMALIVSQQPAVCAGVFTRNRVVAAPVTLTRNRIASGQCQAILVNSGNANACTGQPGCDLAEQSSALAAAELGLSADLIAVASTGVIGEQLTLAPFTAALPGLVAASTPDNALAVAEAMMTTDAFSKTASVQVAGDSPYTILGLAKGAGMIHPDMATMLAFVLTDACIEQELLDQALRQAVENSFNAISVDGDTSTNDTVLLLANGAAQGPMITSATPAAEIFVRQLEQVLLTLAKLIVKDGEGATKLVHIRVVGATDEVSARGIARSVATSVLSKTAFFGEDPNWGRIIAAVGYAGCELDPERIDIDFDQVAVVRNGVAIDPYREQDAAAVLRQDEFVVRIDLHQGNAEASYYTSDLGYEYVRINADYRS
jgi:glutamate N-acetyltransferase/amino-acid N-acetyltransferase